MTKNFEQISRVSGFMHHNGGLYFSKIFNHIESEQIEFNKVDFNFSRCENNISVFKKELNKNEIEYIEKKLKTFLYPL